MIDDTALVKQGKHSVGVARQSCGELGKRANCRALAALTLARAEVPVGVGLRPFLPAAWAADAARRAKAGVPESIPGRPKWRLALAELDRVRAAGATFGGVPADAESGKAASRRGLSARGLLRAEGILPTQEAYPAAVTVAPAPVRATGRPDTRRLRPRPRGPRDSSPPCPRRRGGPSPGGAAPRATSRPSSPPGACGRRTAPSRPAAGTRRARRRGRCASAGAAASARTT